jgi:hypothetical protein
MHKAVILVGHQPRAAPTIRSLRLYLPVPVVTGARCREAWAAWQEVTR